MRPDDKIAVVKQNGRSVGVILADQTIKWTEPLKNDAEGEEPYIEKILAFQADALESIAAVYAVRKLNEAYSGTSVEFVLLVDQFYGTEPDVIS